jgi:hypothetical protein
MLFVGIVLLAAVWVVSGCSAASSSDGTDQSLSPASVQPSLDPSASAAGPNDLPAAVIDPVIAEAARLAGVATDQVTVISAEAVTFSDGSLGCPMPGMVYTQALVDGYKIVVKAGNTMYDFRGTGSTFRLCEEPAG